MRILLTGATGFVGSHTADRLIHCGHTVRALTRSSSSLEWLKDKPIEVASGNLKDPESLKDAVKDVDAIIHIAGAIASKTKQGFYEHNQLGTRGLLTAAHKYGNISRFVFISSQTAGGPSLDGHPVTEETPPHPITTYGKSKLAAEEECKQFEQYFPVTILRLPAIYGPRDTATLSFFQAIKRGLKPLIGFQNKFVNLCYVEDIANGVELALTNPVAVNRLYYIGNNTNYSWHELSGIAATVMKRRGLFVRIPHGFVHIIAAISEITSFFKHKPSVLNWEKRLDLTAQHWTCSIERAQKELGYQPSVSIEEGFERTVRWYKEKKWL
jgi:nucleoside-diphosphate-sugar epimerase